MILAIAPHETSANRIAVSTCTVRSCVPGSDGRTVRARVIPCDLPVSHYGEQNRLPVILDIQYLVSRRYRRQPAPVGVEAGAGTAAMSAVIQLQSSDQRFGSGGLRLGVSWLKNALRFLCSGRLFFRTKISGRCKLPLPTCLFFFPACFGCAN